MGDLVEPRPGVLALLEGVVGTVGLDEGVLGQVGGELGVAEHPEQVRVDLAVVLREERLDEGPGGVVVPRAAHDRAAGRALERAVRDCQATRLAAAEHRDPSVTGVGRTAHGSARHLAEGRGATPSM